MSQPFAPQLIYRTPDGDPTEHATAPIDDSPAAQWLLPDLAVAGLPGDNSRLTVVLADVIAQPGSPRPAQLPGWLRQYYLPGPTAQRPVTGPGPVTIVQGVRMPRDVLAEAHGPVVLELHWNVSWWGLRSGAGHAVLRQPLTFGNDHTTASRHVWRPPTGGIGTRSVAGIDIGTGSTAVTLYAEPPMPNSAAQAWDPRQLGRASRELATLLTLAADPASGLDRAFRGQVEKACTEPFDTIVRELAETYPDDHEQAAAAVTDRLCVLLPLLDDALDTAADSSAAPGTSTEPVLALREQLHRVLAAVYEIPQLFSNGLLPVDLSARPDVRAVVTHSPEPVPSRVVVQRTGPAADDADPPPVDLLSPWPDHPYGLAFDAPSPSGEPDDEFTFRDIKRAFSRKAKLTEPLPPALQPPGRSQPLDTGDIVAGVFALAASRSERFGAAAARRPDIATPPRVDHIVATFPVSLPPAARERVRKIIKHGLGVADVEMQTDEAVAAALYHVGRAVSDPDYGLDGFRARATRIRPGRRIYRENSAVLDFGAGTFDAAVLATYLTETSGPAPEAGRPATAGRRFLLQPHVIGSTGHPQLGGDLISLKVFHWIKAVIADKALELARSRQSEGQKVQEIQAALRGQGERLAVLLDRGLTEALLGHRAVEPVSGAMRQILRTLVPTHWAEDETVPTSAFHQLWTTAEKAKFSLGAGLPFSVPDDLVRRMYPRGHHLLAVIDGQEIGKLDPADFDRLVEPVIDFGMTIALGAVTRALTDQPDQTLDRVVLSGRSSGMGIVEEVVRRRVRDARRAGVRIVGTPQVSVEREHAKQATSIGATWAARIRLHTEQERSSGSDQLLAQGDNAWSIDVDNLALTSPCDFGVRLGGVGANSVTLVATGQRLAFTADGVSSARSPWRSVLDEILVVRALGGGTEIPWGKFRYDLLGLQEGLTDEATGFAQRQPQVEFQLEITQDLVPRVHLRCGHVVHVLPTDAIAVPRTGTGDRAGLVALRWSGDSEQRIPSEDPTLDITLGSCSDLVVDENAPDAQPRRAAIPATPLPRPVVTADGVRWSVQPVFADGRVGEPVDVAGPAGAERTPHYVTVTETGEVFVTRGFPRYHAARSLRDVLQRDGRVLTVEMDEGEPYWNTDWEPFNGRQ